MIDGQQWASSEPKEATVIPEEPRPLLARAHASPPPVWGNSTTVLMSMTSG